ncbi:MAG: hypothetical protein QOC82_2537 [Frankiaceae bacterium]|nr:hypothetical protein [Frankiaceae bacterium]
MAVVGRPRVGTGTQSPHRAAKRQSLRRRIAQATVGSVGLSMLVVAGPVPGLATTGAAASVTATGAAKNGPQPMAKDGEVTSLRTATSRTYRLPSGVYQARVFGHPVNFKDVHGAWQKVDDTLAAVRGGWQSKANPLAHVQIPATLAGNAVTVSSGSSSVGFVLSGTRGVTAAVNGSTARFHDALPNTDVVEQATDVGVKESLVLASSATGSQWTFTPSLSRGLSLRPASDGGLSVVNAAGVTVWRVPAATVVDAAGATSTGVFTLAPDGRSLTLSIDAIWLTERARAFPVTVDPSVVGVSPSAETYIYSGTPTTSYGTATTEHIGHDSSGEYRLLVKYDVAAALPKHVDILQSALQTESLSASAGAISVQTFQSAQAWTTSATWNTYDGTHAWTAAGGDVTGSAIDTQTVPNNSLDGDGDDGQWFGLQPLAASWYGGGTNKGLEVKQSGTTLSVVSWPQGGSMWLNVDYVYRTGLRDYFSYYSRGLNDRAGFSVNTANGNLVLQEKDLQVSGVGVPLQLVRTYNSQGDANPSAGGGFPIKWSQGYGRDVKTDDGWNDGELFYGESGDAYWLEGNPPGSGTYVRPSGFNAFFTYDSSDGSHQVEFHKSGIKLHFGSYGLNDTVKDKNGNTITLTYQTPLSVSSQLTSVTDTQGRSYSLSYTSGHISSMTDANLSTSRSWSYGYDGTNTYLTSYTDPASHTSNYGYSGVGSTSCTAPTGILCTYTDARNNKTTINYDSSDRVTSIQDPGGNCAGAPATGCVTFSYSDPSGTINSSCSGLSDANVVGSTTETDENGHTTIYCWDKSDRVLYTFDGNGHKQQKTYTSNSDVASLTDAVSNVFTLHHNNQDALDSVERVANGCDSSNFSNSTGCPAQLTYPSSATNSIADYQPTSASDGQHNCTAFGYDGNRNVTDSYSGQANTYTVSGVLHNGCQTGGGTHQSNAYQGDTSVPNCGPSGAAAKTGELCSTTDGANHKTSFTYDSNGNLTTISPPAPLGNTSISVDDDGRPTSVTDGALRSTKYFYDGNDRITELRFDGGTSGTCSNTDATNGACISYTYDNNGNLTSRLDNTGTTSWTYDVQNRPLTKSFPSSISTTASTVTYDGVGNVATYTDAGTGTGQVAYTYDAANNLTKIAEPGGTCTAPTSKCITIGYTNNNQRDLVTFPSGEQVLLCYDDGREKQVTAYRPGTAISSPGTCPTPSLTKIVERKYSYLMGTTDVDLRTKVTNQSGTDTFYGYDSSSRLCWVGTASFSSCGSSTSRSFGYNYDNAGNITSAINGGSTTFFGYNNADELCWSGSTNGSIISGSSACTANAGPTGDTDYLYDGAGNTCWTASTTSALNTCSSAPTGATSYSYNTKGQDTAIGSTSFTYADVGQKELVTIGSTTLINGLEGVNRRSDSVNVTRDAGGNLLELRNGDGTTSSNSAYTLDGLGSTIALTDSAGTTDTALYTYDPYGATATSSGTLATTNPFRYAGGYQLTAPSMYHFGDRYYNQGINRWTQRDSVAGSIANANTVDRYVYAGDDAVNHADPNGREWSDIGDFFSSAASTAGCVASEFNPLGSESNGWLAITGLQAMVNGVAIEIGAIALGGAVGGAVVAPLAATEIAAGGYLTYQGSANIASDCG